ncbi:MAG: hypothetical protein MZU91_11530 [Desulfosudis oleivorans]|nr:hypothetical protein [Desulfosudis oleivorans]
MRSRALRLFAALTASTLTIALTALPAGTGDGQEAAGAKPAAPVQAAPVPPRALTAHLIGHAHIDLSWLWRWEETVADIARYTFQGTLAQMDKMPGLTFAQSQAAIYDAIEKDQPELFAAIARKIKEGTWVPVGGMWVEPDCQHARRRSARPSAPLRQALLPRQVRRRRQGRLEPRHLRA